MNPAECLQNIGAVREAIQDCDMAYVARTRLRRMILACTRLVARQCGCVEPELPGPFHPPAGAAIELREIADICSRIFNSTSNLCQPSEPLECRWRLAWSSLEADMQKLDLLLRSLCECDPECWL